jgi:maltose alpha-D-glucosyltransferase / alpha-amylase
LPLACAFAEQADRICRDWPALVVARLTLSRQNRDGVLYDALADQAFCLALLKLISSRHTLAGNAGELEATHTALLRRLRMQGALALVPAASKAEQTNSSIIYGNQLVLKLFRRLEGGINPDLEISRFLSEREFPHSPALGGALEYRGSTEEPTTVGILTAFIPGCRTAWEYTLDALSRFYERVQTLPVERRQAPLPQPASITKLAAAQLTDDVAEMIGTYLEAARLLGRTTAALHVALASEVSDPNFTPEPSTPHSQRGFFQSMRMLTLHTFRILSQRLSTLQPGTRAQAQEILGLEFEILKRFRAIYERSIDAVRIRHHGYYHLGQVLYTGKEFLIIDFEGDPAVSLGERRLKRSPLRDVAEMIHSFRDAAHAALLNQVGHGTLTPAQMGPLQDWARFWSRWVGATFYLAYRRAVGTSSFLPPNETDLQLMTDAYLMRKAIYELGKDLDHRPAWVAVPCEAILELVAPVERA